MPRIRVVTSRTAAAAGRAVLGLAVLAVSATGIGTTATAGELTTSGAARPVATAGSAPLAERRQVRTAPVAERRQVLTSATTASRAAERTGSDGPVQLDPADGTAEGWTAGTGPAEWAHGPQGRRAASRVVGVPRGRGPPAWAGRPA